MEASFLPFQDLQLDFLQVSIVALVLFGLGFWLGTMKSRKLIRKMAKMEKKIMDLNTELLYGARTVDRS